MYEWLVRVAGPVRNMTGLPFEVHICEQEIVLVSLAGKGETKALANRTPATVAGDQPLTAEFTVPSDGNNALGVLAHFGDVRSEYYCAAEFLKAVLQNLLESGLW